MRNRIRLYRLFRFVIFFTFIICILICIAVMHISFNFTIKYIQPANRIYIAKPTFSAQIIGNKCNFYRC
ncbi:hypothetical protein ACH3XW_31250 [Acanthocheilonema viteae]